MGNFKNSLINEIRSGEKRLKNLSSNDILNISKKYNGNQKIVDAIKYIQKYATAAIFGHKPNSYKGAAGNIVSDLKFSIEEMKLLKDIMLKEFAINLGGPLDGFK